MPDVLEVFDVLLTTAVLGFLTALEALPLAAVSRRWRTVTRDDAVWSHWCRADLGLTARLSLDPQGRTQAAPHYRDAWLSWRRWGRALRIRSVNAPLYQRVLAMWTAIEDWTAVHRPTIRDTLAPGASPTALAAFVVQTQQELPDVAKLIWSVHDGQTLAFDDALFRGDEAAVKRHAHQVYDGLFGGYAVYSHSVCTRLHSLRTIAERAARDGRRVTVASSWNDAKPVLLDLTDGSVSVTDGRIPCAPLAAGDDGILRWMEEYARRLTTGMYEAEPLFPGRPETIGISLFPRTGPQVSVAVTRGIEAAASAVFVPEDRRSGFAYSIRLRVVDGEALGHPGAQLALRHWRIEDGAGHAHEVHGEGVIGKFPVLRPGGFRDDEQGEAGPEVAGPFVYQSCTGPLRRIPPGTGQFGGTLDFVAGTLEEPLDNAPFAVTVAPFPIAVPDFIF